MYKYFTTKIHDTGRETDWFPPNSEWGTTTGTAPATITNLPEIRGVSINTDEIVDDADYVYMRKTAGDGSGGACAVGDNIVIECYHDKLIGSIISDFYDSDLGGGAETIHSSYNEPFQDHYRSVAIYRCTATTSGVSRYNFQVELRGRGGQGLLTIWNISERRTNGKGALDTKWYSTKEGVSEEGSGCLPYLAIPEGRERGITPSETSASTSQMSATLYNRRGEVSNWVYGRMNSVTSMFWNDKIEIFGHIDDTSKKRLFLGHIEDLENDPLETEYDLITNDIFDIIKTEIFSRELSEYIDKSSGTEETTNDINEFRMPRGFVFTKQTGEDGEPLRKIDFSGHPIDFIYGILKVIFSKPTNSIGVPYLTDAYIDFLDIRSFESIRDTLPSDYANDFGFTFYEGLDDPFEFIQEQIFKPCVIFPYISDDGRLGVKYHTQPLSSQGVEVLDESKIKSIDSKRNSMDDYTNHMMIRFNLLHNFDEEEFTKATYAIDPDALTKTRLLSPRDEPLTFEMEGINFGYTNPAGQNAIVQNVIDSYLSRYGSSITEIVLTTTLDTIPNTSVGDYIELIHDDLIEWKGERAGQRGLTTTDVDPGDPIALLNDGTEWAGFVNNNAIGTSQRGYVFLNTQVAEIQDALFVGAEKSCQTNHTETEAWLTKQGH